jgi:ELWxxDGT repeat protein
LLFAAFDQVHGRELWQSDGTASGTFLVSDIRPGHGSGLGYTYYYLSPSSLLNVGGTLFFRANDGSTGEELWKAFIAGPGGGPPPPNPGPPGPSPKGPSCTLKATGSKVRIRAPKHKKGKKAKKASLGTLVLVAKCDQAVSEALTGKVSETVKKGRHHKPKTSTFSLGPLRKSVPANASTTFTVKLPTGAINGLKRGAKESVVFTLSASSATGTGSATAKIGRLHGF